MAQVSAPRAFPPPAGKRTAIITGGSSGIGLACAKALVASGWHVAISGRRQDVLEQAVKDIQAVGAGKDQVISFAGDMAKEEDVSAFFRMTGAWAPGHIDLVFINAGRGAPAVPIQEASFKDWQSVVDINLTGSWLCAREAFRYMADSNGGRIIFNGSISAHTPRPHSAAYTATKHAVSGLAKTLSLDGRKHNIAVSQIDIGNAASDMTKNMVEGPGVQQADGSFRHEPTMDTTHVANQIVHMASLPLDVNIQDIVILATKMPSYIGRG